MRRTIRVVQEPLPGRAMLQGHRERVLREIPGVSRVPYLLAERPRWNSARSMRAVKGSLGHSPKER